VITGTGILALSTLSTYKSRTLSILELNSTVSELKLEQLLKLISILSLHVRLLELIVLQLTLLSKKMVQAGARSAMGASGGGESFTVECRWALKGSLCPHAQLTSICDIRASTALRWCCDPLC
jgi:hypothetical protein